MLIDDLKARITAAMRARNNHERDTLKVALGEIQLAETRSGKALTEDESQAALKKVIKGNREMIALVKEPDVITRLEAEIAILDTLLPTELTADQIADALTPVADAVRAAGNDGQATGLAMKHLKSAGHAVNGKAVSAAVRQLRTP